MVDGTWIDRQAPRPSHRKSYIRLVENGDGVGLQSEKSLVPKRLQVHANWSVPSFGTIRSYSDGAGSSSFRRAGDGFASELI
jgi:hypothetical protein